MSIKNKVQKCAVGIIIGIVLALGVQYKSDSGAPLRFSQASLEIQGNAEGCRREPYLCPVGRVTQGIGHTGPGAGSVTVASDQQIAAWWAEDLRDTQNFIEQKYEKKLGRQWPKSVFDGMGSFIFNVGGTKFSSYPTVNAFLRRGDWVSACKQIQRFIYGRVDGKMVVLPGLIDRRQKEMALCLRDVA
ncbi:glycoside hydrolase family protein [Sodalis sp. RH18]|uniref:glycoside hydrolase family protein n=1 Tax=Sodalis sp. RH18 TaxID=3394333 RepID=UPI0039B5E005